MYIQEVYEKGQISIITIRVVGESRMINYCYLITDNLTKYCYLVDPAWEFDKIDEIIRKNNLTPVGVLLTHAHYDHLNLAESFSDKYQITIWISDLESMYYSYTPKRLEVFTDGQYLYKGNILVEAWLTPGHSPGSSCFYIENKLMTGDTLFIEGCGDCYTKGGDPKALYKSLQRINSNCLNDTMIYPGHSFGKPPGLLFNYVKEHNIYLQFIDEESFTKFRMRKYQPNLLNFQ